MSAPFSLCTVVKEKEGWGGISFFFFVIFAEFEGVVVALVSGGRCWTLGFGQWLRMYCQCSWEDIEKHVTTKTVLSNWEDEIGNNLSEHCPGIDNVLFFFFVVTCCKRGRHYLACPPVTGRWSVDKTSIEKEVGSKNHHYNTQTLAQVRLFAVFTTWKTDWISLGDNLALEKKKMLITCSDHLPV